MGGENDVLHLDSREGCPGDLEEAEDQRDSTCAANTQSQPPDQSSRPSCHLMGLHYKSYLKVLILLSIICDTQASTLHSIIEPPPLWLHCRNTTTECPPPGSSREESWRKCYNRSCSSGRPYCIEAENWNQPLYICATEQEMTCEAGYYSRFNKYGSAVVFEKLSCPNGTHLSHRRDCRFRKCKKNPEIGTNFVVINPMTIDGERATVKCNTEMGYCVVESGFEEIFKYDTHRDLSGVCAIPKPSKECIPKSTKKSRLSEIISPKALVTTTKPTLYNSLPEPSNILESSDPEFQKTTELSSILDLQKEDSFNYLPLVITIISIVSAAVIVAIIIGVIWKRCSTGQPAVKFNVGDGGNVVYIKTANNVNHGTGSQVSRAGTTSGLQRTASWTGSQDVQEDGASAEEDSVQTSQRHVPNGDVVKDGVQVSSDRDDVSLDMGLHQTAPKTLLSNGVPARSDGNESSEDVDQEQTAPKFVPNGVGLRDETRSDRDDVSLDMDLPQTAPLLEEMDKFIFGDTNPSSLHGDSNSQRRSRIVPTSTRSPLLTRVP